MPLWRVKTLRERRCAGLSRLGLIGVIGARARAIAGVRTNTCAIKSGP